MRIHFRCGACRRRASTVYLYRWQLPFVARWVQIGGETDVLVCWRHLLIPYRRLRARIDDPRPL